MLLTAMTKCKMTDIIFALTSSLDSGDCLSFTETMTFDILEHLLEITALTFRDLPVEDIVMRNKPLESFAADLNAGPKARKPIRHGRFSGSISVQLSTGESMVITKSSLFASGMPGSLDVIQRRNRKLEDKMFMINTGPKRNFSPDEKSMLNRLTRDYLDSHFNNLFGFVANSEVVYSQKQRYLPSLMEIAAYFSEYCRLQAATGPQSEDLYPLIYGSIDSKFVIECIEMLHCIVSTKNYPMMLRLLKYYRESLLFLESFSKSSLTERSETSANLQRELFRCKTFLLMTKRTIAVAKPVSKYFLHICAECNHILFKLVERYAADHQYWYVSSAPHIIETLARADPDCEEMMSYGSEANYSWTNFMRNYSSRDIVDFYALLLSNCQFEKAATNRQVARFFYRMIKNEDCSQFLMRPSLVVMLQKVLAGPGLWMQQNVDLVTTSRLIVRNFSNRILADPFALIRSFFN